MESSETELFGPERIRALRGEVSRAVFARRVGVTPLTVYRWELPDGSPEARRPRGRILRALSALERTGEVELAPQADRVETPDAAPMPSPEQQRLWSVLARAFKAEWRQVEEELLALLASGALQTPGARALAAVGMAFVQRFGRDDPRSAFSTLAPHLSAAEAGMLPAHTALQVHTMAALLFSSTDGRLFDAGKVHAQVALAERLLPEIGETEVRNLLRLAELNAALLLGDPDLIRRAYSRGAELFSSPSEPVVRLMTRDALASETQLYGQGSLAMRRFAEVVEESGRLGFPMMEARALAFLASQKLEEACDPPEALALTARARESARRGNLAPGFRDTYLACTEGEALVRLGRFEEAARVLDAGERIASDLQWTALQLQPTRGRLLRYLGDGERALAHARRLQASELPLHAGLTRAYGTMLEGMGHWAHGDAGQAAQAFDRALQSARKAGGWLFLQRGCAVHGFGARIAANDLEGAAEALPRAEQMVERLPSAWWTALLRRFKGMFLCKQGQLEEGSRLLEAALGTFTLAQDLPEAALTRRSMATAAFAAGDPGAEARLVESEAELKRLGMAIPPGLEIGFLPRVTVRPRSPRAELDASALLVPFERLSVRGVGPALLQRELLAVAAELFPGRGLLLEELDSRGEARVVAGARTGEVWTSADFGDGGGRRLRLSVEGETGDEARALLLALARFTGMAMEVSTLRGFAEVQRSAPAPDPEIEVPGFIAASPEMKRLRGELSRLSGSRSTIIVTGESGAGKEVVARTLHRLSTRASRPYVAFNCASVPRDLFEGQLFGYRRGAFTGADSDHPGVIRAAHGGTLFLDEIGELPLDVQPKLLRFLENGEIFPLGETRPVQVDVRVIAATHRDLARLVREGRFREDLYYRLQVVPVRIPPLRERREDIVAIARHFVAQLATGVPPTLSPDALAALVAHDWPGNVRELRNVLERSMAFAPNAPVLSAEQLRIRG